MDEQQQDKGGKIGWSQQNLVIVGLLLVVIVLLTANLLREPSIQLVAPIQDADRESFNRKAERGREEDPYIANQVKNTIVKGYVQIRDCYNVFIDRNPAVTDGKIMVDWTINEKGEVDKAELVSSEIPDEELPKCIVTRIKGFKFPPPPAGRPKYVAHKFFLKKDTTRKSN